MKTKDYKIFYLIIMIILFLSILIQTQQVSNQTQKNQTTPQQPDHLQIDLQKPYPRKLDSTNQFTQKYRIKIPKQTVTNLKQDKWYLFVEVETKENFSWQKTKIQLYTVNGQNQHKKIKECEAENGVDSCFLTNKNFNYEIQKVQAKVICEQTCQFTISASISVKYKLQPQSRVQLDFQNTAYTKLFTLDTNKFQNFKRLHITLRAKGFLSYNSPIRLYANKGQSIPTKQKHDYQGIHLWDDGLGLFINYPDASDKFTILVEGPEKNVLILESKIFYENTIVQVKGYEPSFSYLEAQQKQMFKVKVDKTQKMTIKLTTLTGSIELGGLKDEDKKQIQTDFSPLSRTYGQLQYKIDPSLYTKNQHKNKINQFIYIQIKGNKDSTFVFEYFNDNSTIQQLNSEVNRYATLNKKSSDYYYLKLVESKSNVNQTNKQARIQIMTTTFADIDLSTKIFLCRQQDPIKCQPTSQQQQKLNKNQSIDTTTLKQITKSIKIDNSIPGVRYLDTVINYSDFWLKDDVYRVYVIIILFNPQDNQLMYTLQYINLGQTYFLKQKQLRKDRLSINQIKYYKFVNNDPDVKKIKVHSTEISGQVVMIGYKEDPRYKQVEGKQVYEFHGAVVFEDVKKGEEIYVQVQGVDNAYYSLYLQLVRDSENDQQNDQKGYNQIIIQSEIQYDFFIKPKQKMILQLHPKQEAFELWVSSHLPLQLCMTENLKSPPFKPNCQIAQKLSKSQRMSVSMDNGLIGNMGIINSNDKAVQFKIRMKMQSSASQVQCFDSPMGLLNKWNIQINPKTNKTAPLCYKFNLNRRQNLQIIVDLLNFQYEKSKITWQLNDVQKQLMLSEHKVIFKKEIQKICGEDVKNKCQLILKIEAEHQTTIEGVVQFLDKDVLLVDGLAQPAIITSQSQQKYFRYELINHLNTTIILQNKAGFYMFYGKIVSRTEYLASYHGEKNIFPTEQSHLFKSQNPFFSLYHIYLLTQDSINKSNCTKDCILLISVVKDQKNAGDQRGLFIIECSQEDRFLKQNYPVLGYLQGGSLAFYQYYNPSNGTVYLQLHNQGNPCARIFVKKGTETRASPSSYDYKSDNENSIILNDATQGHYSITLQANYHGCSYTIQGFNSKTNVMRLKRGIFSDKVFKANESVYYLYEHQQNQTFKVVTLNKAGQVELKIRRLQEEQIQQLLSSDEKISKQFQAGLKYYQSNVDFLRVQNTNFRFCFKCTYLILATATKYTQTSIVIPSKDVQIPVAKDALVKDIVKAKQKTKYRIFTSNIAKYQIYVQYGKINLSIVESINKREVINKVYNQTKSPIYETINSSSESGGKRLLQDIYEQSNDNRQLQQIIGGDGHDFADFVHYSIVTIQGIDASSFYSFELLSNDDQTSNNNKVKYGIPQYFYLEPKQTKCFQGVLDDSSEQFIVAFDNVPNRKIVEKIDIKVQVNNKTTTYERKYGLTQMVIQLTNMSLSGPAPYTICFTTQQVLSLTFIQSAHIILLPSDTTVFIPSKANLTFGSKGTVIMQIDQCSSRSILSVSSSFNNLHTSDTEIKQVRRSNNLVEFNHWGPVYVHLESNQGTRIRWRNQDAYTEKGVGYQKFATRTIYTYVEKDSIVVDVKPLEQLSEYETKQVKFKVTSVNYKVILAKNQTQLRRSMNCNQGNTINYQKSVLELSNGVAPRFQIQQLRQMFSQQKQKYFFVGTVAHLNIEVNGTLENYRFNYPIVDVQMGVLYGGRTPFEVDESGEGYFNWMVMLVGGVVVIGLGLVLYKKVIRKILRKRRQKLSEQGAETFKYTEFASMD